MFDLAVLGAGPAGLAAARASADAGLTVALVDAAQRPGGQYYRQLPQSFHARRPDALHHGWPAYARLRDAVSTHPRIHHRAAHRVWMIEPGFRLHATVGERERRPERIDAAALVLATGAHDRSLPFPGWDLPGVLTAGGAQALLKGDLVTAGKRIVVAGTGPFLLPVTTGLAMAGADVAGVYEANRPTLHLAKALGTMSRAGEAAGYGARLLRHRIPYRLGYAVIAVHGRDSLEAVTVARVDRDWRPLAETAHTIECDTLAVSYGFTPQLELPLQLGCDTMLDDDGSLVVVVDTAQRTSVHQVYAAGETTGVGGAQLALVEGELAGLAAAAFGAPGPRRLLRERRRLRMLAAALRAAYPVRAGWMSWVGADTIVCRCEEVPYGRLAEAVTEFGATDPRTAKLLSRAGMGWCQGRVCGYATAHMVVRACGRARPEAADVRGLAQRPFANPVRLGELAGSATELREGDIDENDG